jgi:nucleotide-binding universal stress UspA family protein
MKVQTDTQLLMERSERVADLKQSAGSGIKTILFHIHDDDAVMDRLQVVLSLARACGAHVNCLHVTPIQAYTVVDTFGGTFVNQEIVAAFEQQAAKLRKEIETQLKLEDVAWTYEEITGELVPHLVQLAALADLLITGREPQEREFGGPAITLIGDLLEHISTPILVIGNAKADFDPLAPAVVAWNGSYEAANAVRVAVPLLRLASKVAVVQFSEKRQRRFPSTALLEYLSRQGIHAEMETRATSGAINEALVSYAERLGAGVIVMGGYSHSRAGEFLFGGVTRTLLKDCPVTLVISR